jgi:oxalate decarboxylase/phosphoglucose isomerase-like protein (cupin superfamily)
MSSISNSISRRDVLAVAAAGGALSAATVAQAQTAPPMPQPTRPGKGGTNPGPKNPVRASQNQDILSPPAADHGTLPNLRFSFDDSHMRLESGGWTRQVTVRELGVSKNIAGVNMRLNSGGVRELHWHKAAEWSYMLYGTARITAIDAEGRNFVDDVGVGDLWYFPPGIPHSIQGLGPDGCEFLLVFDDGDFDEDNTFLLSDFIKHTPPEVLAKNFGMEASAFANVPDMHWHPNTDEWQYYISGQARMGVFASSGEARTFDFFENDVGFVPFAMGHYIENTGNTTLRFLEIFKSDYYADVSFDQWLALTPPELVTAHLHTDPQFIAKLRKNKVPVVPA